LRDGYYLQAHAAIIFIDVTSKITFKNIMYWYNSFINNCPDGKVIIVGNKEDITNKKVFNSMISDLNLNIPYINISTKTNYNINEPFLVLSRMLTNKHHL